MPDQRDSAPPWHIQDALDALAKRAAAKKQRAAKRKAKKRKAKPPVRSGALLAILVLVASSVVASEVEEPYRSVPLAAVATTRHTHVCTVGPVVYVRRQGDGDVHVTLHDGRALVVAEIIPQIPLPAPTKGQRTEVCGITRIDRWHRTAQYPAGWPEIHPVTSWRSCEVTSC